ncbi:hypothetical protein RAA17_05330 [Komagataeibacter rhaeticus]|nr:hypothetical protein [Komagataeibacter rhaeticus]
MAAPDAAGAQPHPARRRRRWKRVRFTNVGARQDRGDFTLLLAEDRDGYEEALDYFEVNFDGALSTRKLDAQKPAWRDEKRNRPLENPEQPGEIALEVETAIGDFDPFAEKLDEIYRLKLDAAIEALPEEQIRIVEMLRLDIPIDSKDPFAVTIAKTLGRSEKTIRTYRDKAFATLRAAIEGTTNERDG